MEDKDTKAPLISVVMTAKNEAEAVGKVIVDIKHAVPDAEIVIVDSSDDATPEIARSMGARVLRQMPLQGYNKAMDLALRSAAGQVIVTLDCDGTYPAESIPALAREILDGNYDVVDGSRLESRPTTMPLINYLANRGFALLASVLFFRRITDLHSGMRAYNKNVIEDMHYNTDGEALPVELLLRPIRMGRRVKSIFIDYRNRIGVSKLKPLQSAWWTLRRIILVRFGRP